MTSVLSRKCSGVSKRSGKPCRNWAIQGGTVCSTHGGKAPQVKAKADVRFEVMSWGLTDQHEDPGEVLLRLVTQSAARAARYAAELESLVDEEGFVQAMIGDTFVSTQFDTKKSGEYIRGLAKLEAEERDRCANFCKLAIAAGLAERQVRLAERTGEMLATLITGALAEAQLPPEMAERVKVALAGKMQELMAG